MNTENIETEQVPYVDPETQPVKMDYGDVYDMQATLNTQISLEEFAKGWPQPMRRRIIRAVGENVRAGWKEDEDGKYIYTHQLLGVDEDILLKRSTFGKDELREFRFRVQHMVPIKKPSRGYIFEKDDGEEFSEIDLHED